MAPKGHPKRTKIEDEIEHQKSTSLRPSWERLGAILGHLWCHLGGKNHQKTLENVGSRENLDFQEDKVSRGRLGPNLADFYFQNASQKLLLGTLLTSQNRTKKQLKQYLKKEAKKTLNRNLSEQEREAG